MHFKQLRYYVSNMHFYHYKMINGKWQKSEYNVMLMNITLEAAIEKGTNWERK